MSAKRQIEGQNSANWSAPYLKDTHFGGCGWLMLDGIDGRSNGWLCLETNNWRGKSNLLLDGGFAMDSASTKQTIPTQEILDGGEQKKMGERVSQK
jgi:hypothetical protein